MKCSKCDGTGRTFNPEMFGQQPLCPCCKGEGTIKRYKVIVHNEMIIDADSKEEAEKYYYDYTNGTELKTKVILIKK